MQYSTYNPQNNTWKVTEDAKKIFKTIDGIFGHALNPKTGRVTILTTNYKAALELHQPSIQIEHFPKLPEVQYEFEYY